VSIAPPSREKPSAAAFVVLSNGDDLGRATDAARDVARRVGFSPVEIVRIATATAELARNALLYAGGGEARVAPLAAPAGIEITVTDRGPGIPDVERVLSSSYRSKTGMGMGLKGARRLMDKLEISSSSWGTRVVARRYLP
jgi:serine/threonine-protein kinase RsbT